MSLKKKEIREAFRKSVFKRDGNKCKFCNITTNLDAHHITDRNDMPNGGYVKENGITLCEEHHKQAELWHISNGKDHVNGMTPADLYKKIYGSLDSALKASYKLDKSY